MDAASAILIPAMIFAAAVLYSSVGHAGASGYLAAMALAGVAPATMRPVALTLNVLVASIATVRFYRAGHFSLELVWPFAVASVPAAFLGGAMQLPGRWFKVLVGVTLLIAAARLLADAAKGATQEHVRRPPLGIAMLAGAAIGLVSGLTGTGGGIYLSLLLLFAGWAETRGTGGVSAAFILVNSIAGLGGMLTSAGHLPQEILWWAPAAVAGGVIGSELGARRIATRTFRRLLGLVLVVAGTKLLLSP
jgi:uncharacterized membrane protein YfcA